MILQTSGAKKREKQINSDARCCLFVSKGAKYFARISRIHLFFSLSSLSLLCVWTIDATSKIYFSQCHHTLWVKMNKKDFLFSFEVIYQIVTNTFVILYMHIKCKSCEILIYWIYIIIIYTWAIMITFNIN